MSKWAFKNSFQVLLHSTARVTEKAVMEIQIQNNLKRSETKPHNLWVKETLKFPWSFFVSRTDLKGLSCLLPLQGWMREGCCWRAGDMWLSARHLVLLQGRAWIPVTWGLLQMWARTTVSPCNTHVWYLLPHTVWICCPSCSWGSIRDLLKQLLKLLCFTWAF